MNTQLAFVLSGGGARGALQVGAMYALEEHGFSPDIILGTSVGSANSAFVALKGFTRRTLDELAELWKTSSTLNLLPTNYFSLTVRKMLGRSTASPSDRIREFFISAGIGPDLCFSDLGRPRLMVVSSDLSTGRPVLHGEQPGDKVLDALMLSTALPPWILPTKRQGAYLMDGGIVSNLPVEAALKSGAGRIVALDLLTYDFFGHPPGLGGFVASLVYAAERRQSDLELELAKASGVPVLHLAFNNLPHVPFWDFRHTDEMISQSYEYTRGILLEQVIPPALTGSVK